MPCSSPFDPSKNIELFETLQTSFRGVNGGRNFRNFVSDIEPDLLQDLPDASSEITVRNLLEKGFNLFAQHGLIDVRFFEIWILHCPRHADPIAVLAGRLGYRLASVVRAAAAPSRHFGEEELICPLWMTLGSICAVLLFTHGILRELRGTPYRIQDSLAAMLIASAFVLAIHRRRDEAIVMACLGVALAGWAHLRPRPCLATQGN